MPKTRCVMLIRHAEEPDEAAGVQGVDEQGRPDADALSVRGWQRAGALARLFAPAARGRHALPAPVAIFAATDAGKSRRPLCTAQPLARRLGLDIDTRFGSEGPVEPLLEAVRACEGPVLLVWRHQALGPLAQALAGPGRAPAQWDPDRFDLLWRLQRRHGAWRFSQRSQDLLPGDGQASGDGVMTAGTASGTSEAAAGGAPESAPLRWPGKQAMHELELKLQVPKEARAGLEAALDVAHWERTPLEAHYFDTAGGMLAAHGFSWRLRREGGRWVQTLKGDGGHLLQRLEDEVAVAPEEGRSVPRPDVARHRDSPAGRALAKALGGSLDDLSTLVVEGYHTRIERRTRLFTQGETRVEVAYDHGTLHAGGHSLPVCELELELKGGPGSGLFELARSWMAQHPLWLSTASKSRRGALLAAGRAHGPVVKAGVPALDWSMSPPALLRAVVAGCLAQILPNAGEIGAGSTDADHVHQARVGLRRLRTALRELASFGEVLDAERQQVLATAFSRLGEVRDQEAVARAVTARLAAAGAPRELQWPAPAGELHSPGSAVRDPAFQAVLLDLLDYTLREPAAEPACKDDGACRKGLRARLAALHKQVVRDGERFTELPVEQQHRVRKRLKRLRYLSEFLTPLYGERAVERYVEALRPAQDALGVHNDDAVGLEAFQRATATQPQAWFAVGWLGAQQQESARECRRALRKVADAPRFWKKKRRH